MNSRNNTMSPSSSLFVFVFALLASLLAALVSAAPVPMQARDVFVPPVTYPHAGTVWKVGNHHNVTWDTSDAPVNITNKIGSVYLAKGGLFLSEGPGSLSEPLASNFSILLGRIEVQVPDVTPGDDYAVVLFGDSGNDSADFTIEA